MDDAKLISAALKLPPRKREKVAEALLASLKKPSQGHLDRLWAQESESRIDALLAGKIKTVAGEKVLQFRARK
jgi:putative addiction module component (TIGR02574 family)